MPMMRPIHVAKNYKESFHFPLHCWHRCGFVWIFLILYFSIFQFKTMEMTSEKVINIFWPEFDQNFFYPDWPKFKLAVNQFICAKKKIKRERNGKFSVHLAIPQWLNLDRRRLSLFGKLNTSYKERSEVQHKIST